MLACAGSIITSSNASAAYGALDATAHGIDPSSLSDQSAAIVRLLEKASRRDVPVFFPPGTYVVRDVAVPSRTRMVGVPDATIFQTANASPALRAIACETFSVDGIAFRGVAAAGGDPLSGMIDARACPRMRIRNCSFEDAAACSINTRSCGGEISDNRFRSSNGLAELYCLDSTGLAIRENAIGSASDGGILVHRSSIGPDNTIVTGNRIANVGAKSGGTGPYGNGINLYRAGNVIVANNHVSNCAFSSVRANSASNAQISGNTCLASGETAIYAEFAFEGSVITGNIIDGATIGVSIANFMEGGRMAVCSNNLIRNLTTSGPYPAEVAGFGIGIFAEADTSVVGNVVEGAPQYGIGVGWGPYLRNVIAANNIVRRSGAGIAVSVVERSGAATIEGNLFQSVERGGIIGRRWNETVTGDLSQDGAQRFSHLHIEGNRTI